MGGRAGMMWCSVALTVAGTTAFVRFVNVAEARCLYEPVPVREWTLLLAALTCGALGLLLFHLGWIRALRTRSDRGRRGLAFALALVFSLPTYLLIPGELHLIGELRDKHGVGEVSDCFGRAAAVVEPPGTSGGASRSGDLPFSGCPD
ncbi:hypothetical protein ACIBSV_43825 [Embleya sp. NPDC050154]|uniref:hypothetical protein n=1 Tax=Embleya sp. NPDC050154 TaxID=3363988 RepID=UPI0037A7B29B